MQVTRNNRIDNLIFYQARKIFFLSDLHESNEFASNKGVTGGTALFSKFSILALVLSL